MISSKTRLLLLLPAADAVALVGVFISASAGVGWDAGSLGLLAYNLLSPAALVALVVLTAGLWPRGTPVTVATSVLFSGVLVTALIGMGSSSTGVLLLLVLPIYFWVALFPFACLGVLVHWLRGAHRRRSRAGTDSLPVSGRGASFPRRAAPGRPRSACTS